MTTNELKEWCLGAIAAHVLVTSILIEVALFLITIKFGFILFS